MLKHLHNKFMFDAQSSCCALMHLSVLTTDGIEICYIPVVIYELLQVDNASQV